MPTLEETRSIEYPPIEETPEETGGDDAGAEGDGAAEDVSGGAAGESTDVPADASKPAAAGGDAGSEGAETPEGTEAAEGADQKALDPDKTRIYDELNDLWNRDKVEFLKRFAAGLTADERAAVLGDTQQTAEPVPGAWEPESDGERWLQQHTKTIEALPGFAQGVQREFARRDAYLDEAMISNAALHEQVRALTEMLGLELPAADRAKVRKAMADGKTSFEEAMAKEYRPHLQKIVSTKRQADKPRPRTPGNQSTDTVSRHKPGTSMAEIYKNM